MINFAMLTMSSLALAQDPEPEAEPASAYEEMSLADLLEIKVTTATRNERSLAEAPATVYLITDDIIRSRGYGTVIDVLRDIPEVQLGLRTTEESAAWVTMRGISGNSKFLVLRDGVRAQSPTGMTDSLLQTWSLFDVERIEVILGPASALYGADAFAGIINVISKSGSDLQGATITASYGMYNTTHDAVVWGNDYGDVQVSFSAQGYHSDDPYFPQYYPEDYAAYLEYQETGQLDLFGAPTQVDVKPWSMPYDAASVRAKASIYDLDLSYFVSAERFVPAMSSTVNQTVHSDKAQYFLVFRDQLAAHHRYETLGERPVTFDTLIARTSDWFDPKTGYVNVFTGYDRSYKMEYGTQTTAQELVTFSLAEGWTLSTGLAYDVIDGMPKSADLSQPYDPSKPSGSQDVYYANTEIPVKFYTIEDRNLGATGQLQAQLAPSVEVTLGTRYDYSRRYGSTINPRGSVVLKPADPVTVKLLYGEAYLAPTLLTSYQHYGNFNCTAPGECAGGFFHIPGEPLEPEKLRTGELLTSIEWTDDVVTSVSTFYTQLTNQINTEGGGREGSFLGVDAVYLQYGINQGSLTSYGGTVKTEVHARTGAVDLRFSVAYTYTDGDIEDDVVENALPNTAPHTIKAGVRLLVNRFSLDPRLVYASTLLTTQGNEIPPSPLLNVAARYENLFSSARTPLDLFVTGTNVLDQRYYAPPAIDLGGGYTMPRIPQDPLRVVGGVSLSF
jgi:outer membrane receptor protein involved in Fe transport